MVHHLREATARREHRVGPVRTCVGCRERAWAAELLRMVAVDGQLVVDEGRRLPGRGVWLHAGLGCLAKAERRRAFPRALRVAGALDVQGARWYFEQYASAVET